MALRLNALRTLDDNVHLLKKYLASVVPKSGWALNSPAVDVLFCLPCSSVVGLPLSSSWRSAFIQDLGKLYTAVTEVNIQATVDIIPAFYNDGDSPSDSAKVVPLTKSFMLVSGSSLIAPYFDPSFSYVAVGGTFDRLHAGHKLLLTVSALHTVDLLRVGITGPELLTKKKFSELLQSYDERRIAVETFLKKLRPDLGLEIEMINDFSGGTDKISGVQALVASPETIPAIPKINALRSLNGFSPLVAIPIDYVGGAEPSISSTKLREFATSVRGDSN